MTREEIKTIIDSIDFTQFPPPVTTRFGKNGKHSFDISQFDLTIPFVVRQTNELRNIQRTTAGKWTASISYNKKRQYLGSFDTKEEAVDIVRAAEEELIGVLALLLPKPEKVSEVVKPEPIPLKPKSENRDHKKGVRQNIHGKWTANLYYNGKTYYIGTFATDEEAVNARNKKIAHLKEKKNVINIATN